MLIKAGNFAYGEDLPEQYRRQADEPSIANLPLPGRRRPAVDTDDARIPMRIRAQYPRRLGCDCEHCGLWHWVRTKWVAQRYGSWERFHAAEGCPAGS